MLASSSAKKLVAEHAASLIENGMIVGLGTGSTANYFIEAFILESVYPKYDEIVHRIPRKIQVQNILCTKILFLF